MTSILFIDCYSVCHESTSFIVCYSFGISCQFLAWLFIFVGPTGPFIHIETEQMKQSTSTVMKLCFVAGKHACGIQHECDLTTPHLTVEVQHS